MAAQALSAEGGANGDDGFIGAANVIREITARLDAARDKSKNANVSEMAEVKAFADAAKSCALECDDAAPAVAAERWLELAEQFFAIPREGRFDASHYGRNFSLVKALPPPGAWPLIREGLARRQAEAFSPRRALQQIMMAYLARDFDAANTLLDALAEMEHVKKDDSSFRSLKDVFGGRKVSENEAMSRKVDELRNMLATVSVGGYSSDSSLGYLPDLASALPKEEAEQLFRSIFKQRRRFHEISDKETLAMAQRVALEMREDMPAPYWELVTASPDGEALFAAFTNRFPQFERKAGDKKQPTWADIEMLSPVKAALMRLVLPKVNDGLAREAADMLAPCMEYVNAQFADDADGYKISRLRDISLPREARAVSAFLKYDFYAECFERFPGLPVDSAFIKAALSCGQSAAVEKLLLARMADDGLTAKRRRDLQESHAALLLASDRVAEALAIRGKILADAMEPRRGGDSQDNADFDEDDKFEYALENAELAALAGDDEALRDALDAAEKIWNGGSGSGDGNGDDDGSGDGSDDDLSDDDDESEILSAYAAASFLRALEKHGRAGKVEKAMIDLTVRRLRRGDDDETPVVQLTSEQMTALLHDAEEMRDLAVMLLQFYVRQGRMSDAIALLEDAPLWGGARDVLQLLRHSRYAYYGGDYYDEDEDENSGGLTAAIAKTLHAAGRANEAALFLDALMLDDHSRDWTYELLLQIAETKTQAETEAQAETETQAQARLEQFIAKMDALHARDAFEERPLIWKAEALRRLKRLDEAEAAARLALKIDPTDGEQPAGDRVRAYAVLGAILEELGKTDDAKFFKDVVESVRIAEEGDKLNALGLAQRSLDRYAEASQLFADAYCVQWRLAERLREMGKTDEAQKHYEIAFERMPEQFGQVASLCFGCVGVFDSAESASAAETVLTRLVEMPPVRPAAYYLMGQLREKQKRHSEACDWFAKALESDPGYLDAMLKLNAMKKHIDRDDIDWAGLQARILRLDPLGRHIAINASDIQDWPLFWSARAAILKTLPEIPDAIFPLAANAKRLDEMKAQPGNPLSRRRGYTMYSFSGGMDYSMSGGMGYSASSYLRDSEDNAAPGARNIASARVLLGSDCVLHLAHIDEQLARAAAAKNSQEDDADADVEDDANEDADTEFL